MAKRDDPTGVKYERPPRLGELLVAQGAITSQQLAEALERQKTSGRRLGEELIHAGVVKRSVVSRALRMQRRIGVAAICTIAVSSIQHDVEAAARSQVQVSANNPEGYAVDFFPRVAIFKSVTVSSSSAKAHIGEEGGTMIVRGQHGHKMPLDLSYRFELHENLAPGTYAWPLAVSVRAF